MSVHLVPFGNAQYYADGDTWWFTCQHGVEECDGNKMLACALTYYNDTDLTVPFIGCVEAADEPQNAGENCSRQIGLDWDVIGSCFYSEESSQLLYEFGLETEALNPPHTYVPWIVVDGVHTEILNNAAEEHLLALVCALYQGDKPTGCAVPADEDMLTPGPETSKGF
jgi:interferon gamma-inducible protein 30